LAVNGVIIGYLALLGVSIAVIRMARSLKRDPKLLLLFSLIEQSSDDESLPVTARTNGKDRTARQTRSVL
jgi:hypothetical protein